MNGLYIVIFGFVTSFIVVLFSMPSLIKVAKLKNLVDTPSEERKMHRWSIPTLGGVVIFGAIIFSYALWFPEEYDHIPDMLLNFKYAIACLLVLFFVGVKDDIIGTAPLKKLIAHVVVGFILVIMADIRILSMHGIFGVYGELDLWQSYLLTIFTYLVIINSINLIDGLDGLAGLISFLAALCFSYIFCKCGNVPLALLASVLAGTMIGFVFFNFSPARVFMGDAGSLSIGVIFCILAINAINENFAKAPIWLSQLNKPVLVMTLLAYPLMDTLRVFILRLIRSKSPFKADKNHIHHHFEKTGIGHARTSLTLFLFSISLIALQLLFQLVFSIHQPTVLLFLQISASSVLMSILYLMAKKISH